MLPLVLMFWGVNAKNDHWAIKSVGKYYNENYHLNIITESSITITNQQTGNWGSERLSKVPRFT